MFEHVLSPIIPVCHQLTSSTLPTPHAYHTLWNKALEVISYQ